MESISFIFAIIAFVFALNSANKYKKLEKRVKQLENHNPNEKL